RGNSCRRAATNLRAALFYTDQWERNRAGGQPPYRRKLGGCHRCAERAWPGNSGDHRATLVGDMSALNQTTRELPAHLSGWQLPTDWRWGATGVASEYRHAQEVIDALGRSLALVTAPNPDHAGWLAIEARHLAHLSHPSIPTTYH